MSVITSAEKAQQGHRLVTETGTTREQLLDRVMTDYLGKTGSDAAWEQRCYSDYRATVPSDHWAATYTYACSYAMACGIMPNTARFTDEVWPSVMAMLDKATIVSEWLARWGVTVTFAAWAAHSTGALKFAAGQVSAATTVVKVKAAHLTSLIASIGWSNVVIGLAVAGVALIVIDAVTNGKVVATLRGVADRLPSIGHVYLTNTSFTKAVRKHLGEQCGHTFADGSTLAAI